MDNPVILIPFRIGCLILGALLIAYGGMSSIFEGFKLKHLDNIKNQFSQGDLKYLQEKLVGYIFTYLLYTLNGAALMLSTMYYYHIPKVLRLCSLVMAGLGGYPVMKEINIFRFKRSFWEVLDVFWNIEFGFHVYAAYIMWRYAVEVSAEEEELRQRIAQQKHQELKLRVKEFENRHSPKSSQKEAKTQNGGVGEAEAGGKEKIKHTNGSKCSSCSGRDGLNTQQCTEKLNESRPGNHEELKDPKSSTRPGRDALNHPQSIGKLTEAKPGNDKNLRDPSSTRVGRNALNKPQSIGRMENSRREKVNKPRIASRREDFQSMFQSLKNPSWSIRSPLIAPESK